MSGDLPFGMRVPGGAWTLRVPEPAPRRHEEDDLHRSVVQFLRIALPDDAVFYHVPNGGQRHNKAAARLVGLGVRAGVPDLAIVHHGRALFIELKTRTGRLSAAQKQMMQKLIHCGAEVMACRSVRDVEAALRECGVHLRATVMA